MIFTNNPQTRPSKELCEFIVNELGLTVEALELGIKQSILENSPLPIVLWNFGLINLNQYQELLDWCYKT
tara:strand:+ start:820 stop:1029 length:210 start_codon:yes stop_codon:yes gene_type:complete